MTSLTVTVAHTVRILPTAAADCHPAYHTTHFFDDAFVTEDYWLVYDFQDWKIWSMHEQ